MARPIEPVNSLSPTDAAYLAGVVDGEGSVWIRRQGKEVRLRTRNVSVVYVAVLTINNTDLSLLSWVVERVGGAIRKAGKNKLSRKQGYVWTTAGQRAAKVLEQLLPYLIVKRAKAEVAIRLYDGVWGVGGHKVVSAVEMERREEVYELFKSAG